MKNYKFFIIALKLFGTQSIFPMNYATEQKIKHDIEKLTKHYQEIQQDYVSPEWSPELIKLLKSQDVLYIEKEFYDMTKENKILEETFFKILNDLKINDDIKKNIFSILKEHDKKLEICKENSSFVDSMFPYSKINDQEQESPRILFYNKEKIEDIQIFKKQDITKEEKDFLQEKYFILKEEQKNFEEEIKKEENKFIILRNNEEKISYDYDLKIIICDIPYINQNKDDKVKEFFINSRINSDDEIREILKKEALSEEDIHRINELITYDEETWELSYDLFKFYYANLLQLSNYIIMSKKLKDDDNMKSIFPIYENLHRIHTLKYKLNFEQIKCLKIKNNLFSLLNNRLNIEEDNDFLKEENNKIFYDFFKNKCQYTQNFLEKNKKLSDFNQKELSLYIIYSETGQHMRAIFSKSIGAEVKKFSLEDLLEEEKRIKSYAQMRMC